MALESELEAFRRRHRIALVLQFGSTVGGAVHERSDVDIGLLFDRPRPGLHELAEINADVQRLFPSTEVDLAVLDRADPLFLHQVLGRCRLLAGASRRLAELRIYAFKRYQDHRRFLDMEREHVRRVLART